MGQDNPAPATRPLPLVTDLSRPFWEACKRRELLVQQCQECKTKYYPPSVACGKCLTTNVQWVKTSGKGRVKTYTVLHQQAGPGFSVPLVLAIIQMDDGYPMLSNIVDCDPNEVKIGDPVEVTFEDQSETIALPLFRLVIA